MPVVTTPLKIQKSHFDWRLVFCEANHGAGQGQLHGKVCMYAYACTHTHCQLSLYIPLLFHSGHVMSSHPCMVETYLREAMNDLNVLHHLYLFRERERNFGLRQVRFAISAIVLLIFPAVSWFAI